MFCLFIVAKVFEAPTVCLANGVCHYCKYTFWEVHGQRGIKGTTFELFLPFLAPHVLGHQDQSVHIPCRTVKPPTSSIKAPLLTMYIETIPSFPLSHLPPHTYTRINPMHTPPASRTAIRLKLYSPLHSLYPCPYYATDDLNFFLTHARSFRCLLMQGTHFIPSYPTLYPLKQNPRFVDICVYTRRRRLILAPTRIPLRANTQIRTSLVLLTVL